VKRAPVPVPLPLPVEALLKRLHGVHRLRHRTGTIVSNNLFPTGS